MDLVRALHPEPAADLTDEDLRARYAAPRTPWLRANMVSSADGAVTGADGRSGSLNNAADTRVFHLLRGLADAVVVGAGTARAEGYRPAAVPIVVVSRRGRLPDKLRDAEPGRVLLATCAAAGVDGDDVLVAGEEDVDLRGIVDQLHGRGMVDLLTEGGPHLLGDLLAAGVVDELCWTSVPQLVGGEAGRIVTGPPLKLDLELRQLLEDGGTLLGRWFVRT